MEKTLNRAAVASALGALVLASTMAFAQTDRTSTTERNTNTTTDDVNDTRTTTETTSTKVEEHEDADRRDAGGFFIEPMLIAGLDDSEIKTSQLPIVTDDTSGRVETAGLGLRFGGHLGEVFFLTADGRYNRINFRDSFYDSASGYASNYGVTLGGQTPFFGVRVWGTSVLGGEMDPGSGASGLDVKFNNARGYRVGAGLHVAAVAVNIEYQDLTYGSSTVQSVGSLGVGGDVDVDMTQRGTQLSLSFPVEL